jgi:O-antigen ligase/tetratricopeptide (TPR) repeat protein
MPAPADHGHFPAARFLRAAGEAVLLAMALLSPWAFGSVEPPYEFALSAGVLLLVALWAAHSAVTGRFRFRLDIVTTCLGGLVLWSAIQLVPLPEGVIAIASPARAEWHRTLLPQQSEVLPGEDGPAPRSAFVPLTIDPSATRTFLVRVLAVLLVYAAARNWLASRESFPRLAWGAALTGAALAVLGLGHLATAPHGVVLWTYPVDGEGPFGPFICRNHYPDYAALCAGLGMGLLLPRRTGSKSPEIGDWLLTPRGIGLATAVGATLASIPFCLSRGGILAVMVAAVGAWLLARAGGRGRGPGGLAVAVAAGALGLAAAAWFGTAAVEQRFGTLGTGEAAASRLPLWRDALRVVPGTWLAGTGGGTFAWVEPTVRTRTGATVVYENAHNDYLEALVEGGIVRLGLTVALAAGVLIAVGRGYLRRHDRTVGPWLLGMWFGLAVVVTHALGDFAVHIPAVAVLAAVVAGYALAAARDPEFAPQNRGMARSERERGRISGQGNPETASAAESDSPPASVTSHVFPVVLSLLAALAALGVAMDARNRNRAEQLKLEALRAYWDPHRDDGREVRAELMACRAAVRPNDPSALFDAAAAKIELAVAETWTPGAGLAGGAAGFSAAPDRIPHLVAGRHLHPALRSLREARAANPLAPRPHARLGVYAGYFTSSEPAAVHFARAKRLLPADPDVWYASGREALARGDEQAAWDDWQRSLAISPRHLRPILVAARDRLGPDEIRTRLLPADPAVLLSAAEILFPDHTVAERKSFVEAAARADGPDLTVAQLVAVARAHAELGRTEDSVAAWRRAVAAAPERADVRDGFARWLEREERYGEAIDHLEWLRQRFPGSDPVKDRLDAARHGYKLHREIFGD